MIQAFLKAKHWQLFILLFGIPMILQFTFMGLIFSKVAHQEVPNIELFDQYIMIFPALMFIFMAIYFCWFWSVSVGLQRHIQEEHRLKIGRFKILLIIPFLYIIGFLVFFINLFTVLSSDTVPDVFNYLIFIFPMHLLSMFCMFYMMYFTAKTIKTAEIQRATKFDEFIGEFFLIWFFPIGIWILQPKINTIIATEEDLV